MKSLRNKLTMCTLVVMSVAGVAAAAPRVVFEAPSVDWHEHVAAEFKANRELGRAWIDVVLTADDIGEGLPTHHVVSKQVEGLYYDQVRKQVLYRTAGEPIVCAEDASFLWNTYLKNTGRCPLITVSEKRITDNGFTTGEETVAKVVFDAKTSATPQYSATSAATP